MTNLDELDITDLIRRGVTPLAIEKAYRMRTVRDLSKRAGLKQADISALAERWGIIDRADSVPNAA